MKVNLELLDKEFKELCLELLEKLKEKNITMIPYSGHRSLEDQAKLWREGRTLQEINKGIAYLEEKEAPYLAKIIRKVGPQKGVLRRTNAFPGCSWHQYGKALDCYVEDPITKKAIWNSMADEYKTYNLEALRLGLVPGSAFSISDFNHVQLESKEVWSKNNPCIMTLKQINDYFENKEKS